MSAAHTPGPWAAKIQDNGTDDEGDAFESSYKVESADAFVCGSIAVEADARLIVAAPELLAALVAYDTAFIEFNPDSKESRHAMRLAVIAARAAITKAQGEAA